MEARSPARYLAPIALVATIAGTYLVVRHGTAHHAATAGVQRPLLRGPRATRQTTSARARVYVVQSGDNLSAIAAKTRVSLARLEALNPTLDPNSLQTGRRIRLR